ncbi:MAG: DUF2142 domain-containing protein [Thermoguttaceae bacterium]
MVNDHLPHRFVFVFGLLFGGSLVFLSPPFSVPDELAHFCRAYHCSQGRLYARKRDGRTGDDLPSSLTETYVAITDQVRSDEQFEISWAKIEKAFRISLDPQRQRFTAFSNTALYSPVPYLPQSAALWAARLWGPAPLTMLYLARVANLIVYLLLAAAAVRLTPILKWTLALAALLPMSVYLAASLSADATTIGLSLLVVAATLNLALGSKNPSRRSLLSLGFLLVLLALSKQPYLGMATLFFLIPGKRFFSTRRRWLIAAVIIGVPLAIGAAWTYSLRGLYVPLFSYVDPQAQLRWILNHPWNYMVVMFEAICRLDDYSFMIGAFGWLGPHLPQWIRQTYWAALGLTAVLDGGKPLPLSLRARAVALGAYVSTFAVMATFVYLSWERVGLQAIEGIQPRYFLPIIPLVLLLPRGGAKLASSRFSRAIVPIVAMSVMSIATAVTLWTLVKRYYW